ncbi:hypothetical protein L7F22_011067 [Adiantum nelumboides]|nr:hypothetical protein [Adiantum nelumboides]
MTDGSVEESNIEGDATQISIQDVDVTPSISTTQGPTTPLQVDQHATGSSRKRGRRSSTLQDIWAPSLKKQAEIAEERFFYQCNIAFHASRTRAYKRFVNAISAAAAAGAPITPAGSEALRTTRLTRQVDMVHGMLEGHRESWAVYGCTIMSDGWKDVRKRHLLNILVSCCTGTTFLRAIDMSGAGIRITAHILHPAWRSDAQRSDRVLLTGWNTYVGNGHVRNRLEEDLSEYIGGRGNFSRVIAKNAENQALAVSWWEKFGGLNPTLQTLALRVLSQEVSSSGSERLWSIMGDIHTKDRKRLNTPQLDRLAFVNANLRVLEKAGGLESAGPLVGFQSR